MSKAAAAAEAKSKQRPKAKVTKTKVEPEAPQTQAKAKAVAKKASEQTEKRKPQKQAKAATGLPKVKAVRPQGTAPDPMVSVRHLRSDSTHERVAYGYSISELSGAGLAMNDARRWGVPTDPRRRSALDENVERLKAWLQSK